MAEPVVGQGVSMSDLTASQKAALAGLLAQCPTPMLAQVDAMAAVMPGDKAKSLRRLAAVEAQNRDRRYLVFGPLDPLFRPRADGLPGLNFPPEVRARLWSVAVTHEPHILAGLDRGDQVSRTVADRLCLTAAMALRDNPSDIWPGASHEQIEAFAGCLDLMPVIRRQVGHMEVWLRGGSAAATADLKFSMKQAAAVGPEAPLSLLEVFFAYAGEARLFLRLLTQIATTGRDIYLTQDQMSVFVNRLTEAVVSRANVIKAFDPGAEGAELVQFSRPLKWMSDTLGELDGNALIHPDKAAIQALKAARHDVSEVLAGAYMRAEEVVMGLLPVAASVMSGKMKRAMPKLDAPIDEPSFAQARILLGIVSVSRGPAMIYGRESDRRQTADSLTWRLASWADEAIEQCKDGMVPDLGLACRHIGWVADLLAQLEAREAARSIRRRLAAIGSRLDQMPTATSGVSPPSD